MTPTDIAFAKQTALFAELDTQAADAILENARMRAFRKGELLFAEGDDAKAIFLVTEGWLKLSRLSVNGTEVIVDVLREGQTIGEPVPLPNAAYPVSCHGVTDGRALEFRSATLRAHLHDTPALAVALLSSTFVRLRRLIAQMETLTARRGQQRVADFLLGLTPVSEGACLLHLPYEKELVAGKLGLKPESLSRVFRQLRAQGVTTKRDSVRIDDVARLTRFANGQKV